MALRKRSPKRFQTNKSVGVVSSKIAYVVHSDGTVGSVPLEFGIRNVRCWFLGVYNGLAHIKSTRSEVDYAIPLKGV